MTVSIIIAVKTWQKNLEESVKKCLELDFSDFEVLVLPDHPEPTEKGLKALAELFPGLPAKVRVIPTGPVNPSKKRDLAAKEANGEILAFLDDDAYPVKKWLKNSVRHFQDKDVAAVGGPAVTPDNDSLLQKASGMVYQSFLVGGSYSYRYVPKPKREVDDYPSCNLLVRRSVMLEIGGFNTNFWPGEDTKLCLDITKKLNKKIIYDPEVLVFHHRRKLFLPHIKQIANYGLHRGYFVKKFPQTSLRLPYFVPSIFLFCLLAGAILTALFSPFAIIYFSAISVYLITVFICSISTPLRLIPLVFLGIIISHFTYGFFFIKGLLSRKLSEE
ncbi:MAG: glycosyltransferase [Candidatus Omnitrophica bacterium]|nr:glycosyltransferase [Candidatus Omnitrophota bacterium]